uniref:Uncharacterized protein n=1 Tax=viral metagenome TaxID=1070528 RepID=A0A6M3IT32_9ZZZZ
MTENNNERWAVVELMGHAQTAGIIRTSDLGGLLRVDVPIDDGFRTEYYGEGAVYAIRIVSEEIARAHVLPDREISSFNAPIVPRAQYEEALRKSRDRISDLANQVHVLQNRLTQVNSLPAPPEEEGPFDDEPY